MSDTQPADAAPAAGRGAAPPASPRSPRRCPSSRASCSPSRSCPKRASRRSSRTPTRSWKRSGSSSVGCPTRSSCLKNAGCDIDGERVRFPRGLCAPTRAGDRAARVRLSTRATPPTPCTSAAMATVLAPAYGSPFVRDLDGGRRYGTIEDFRNFVKLAYATPFLHHSGGTVCEPVDLPVNKRHYDMVYAHMKYSDKPFMGSVTHPLRARDTVDMARILFGAEALEERPYVLSLINANSPLVWDSIMLGSAKAYAEANQAVIMTPFILAGAMSAGDLRRRRHADAGRGAGGHGVRAARASRRAGRVRLVRLVDVDAVGRAHLRHAGARARAVRARRLRAPSRRAVPQRRVAHGLQDRRRPGRVRERQHAAADDPRRRQLRAARRGLARGRSRDGLREVRARPRPVRPDARARQGDGPVAQRPGDRRDPRQRPRARTSSAPRTRWPTSRRPSIGRTPPTTTRSSNGRSTGRSTPPSARTRSGSRPSPSTRRPPLDEAKDEELRAWIDRKKASFPDSNA